MFYKWVFVSKEFIGLGDYGIYFSYKYYLQYLYLIFLRKIFGHLINRLLIYDYELLVVTDVSRFYQLLVVLKNHTNTLYKQLTDIVVIDFLKRQNRFRLVYLLLSCLFCSRLQVILEINSWQMVPSIISLFSASEWQERELWDMFGILFFGNYNLRRILTDYGFSGFPLRKDFPISGFFELFYDDHRQRLVYVPLSLAQELRVYRFLHIWQETIK